MIPANYNELTEPTIKFSLWAYFDKYCSGMENRATVNKPFADYLKDFDPEEKYLHVEPSEHKPNELFYIYPIQAWRESVIRLQRQKQISETSRAIRNALAEEEQTIKNKIQRRRDILSECVADALRGPAGHKLGAKSKDFIEWLCYRALIGEVKDNIEKLGVTAELISEFSTLPADPEWKNKYFLQGKI